MSWETKIRILRDDIRAIRRNDPAARNIAEIMLYPGLHAILLHRIAHKLWRRHVPFVPRFISQLSRFMTGIEIHPGARIGRGFFIDHGMGVVIGETTEIGDWVILHQGVTLGGTGKQCGKRHPTLEDRVIVGVNAVVLGAITMGEEARIGGGAVVVKDVPPHATAVGVPARIVAKRDPETGTTRRVEQLPDPEGLMLRGLRAKVLEMETRLMDLEETTNTHRQEHHLTFDALPAHVWSALGDNGNGKPKDEEFLFGEGI
ncbi:MAG: serine O-acetyltransferase [Chloroflexi bacterium AL-W]|nr:serine O-acetyltransferase [Chloroflexi bacterium AL-N1]NOK65044.1 serine O-acetyltransferase [Chloroflexi bacterium AL-N10]NOK72689.1 serine O-acetyltransferase [Chloroflexi bacterium AL-N5]NOK79223.1 serine O-acetyltransferase [Chloroflexi bacterium AL-W]NOK87139.1 serine O-acetyltransferase [Chloroflexi bacterium AL-N15]